MPSSPVRATACAVVAGLLLAAPAGATTFTVDRLDDPQPAASACTAAAGDCSLRGALDAAALDSSQDVILLGRDGTIQLAGASGEDANASGDLDVRSPVSIVGRGTARTTIRAAAGDRVVHVVSTISSGRVELDGLTLAGGSGDGEGRGLLVEAGAAISLIGRDIEVTGSLGAPGYAVATLAPLTLVRARIAANLVGGLLAGGGAPAVLVDSTVSRNALGPAAGAVMIVGGASLDAVRSAVVRNAGGGVTVQAGASAHLENVTVAANARSGGGGLWVSSGSQVVAEDTTVAANTAATGAPILVETGGALVVRSSVLAAPDGALCSMTSGGTVVSLGATFASDTTCGLAGPGDGQGGDLRLGALGDLGGPTETVPLLPGSPAVDHGDAASCPPADARGVARVGRCDAGASELVPADTTAPRVRLSLGAPRAVAGAALVAVRCPAGEASCSGRVVLASGRRVAGGARIVVAGGARGLVLVPLTRPVRRTLAARGRIRLVATMRAADGAGNARTARATLRLRA